MIQSRYVRKVDGQSPWEHRVPERGRVLLGSLLLGKSTLRQIVLGDVPTQTDLVSATRVVPDGRGRIHSIQVRHQDSLPVTFQFGHRGEHRKLRKSCTPKFAPSGRSK